MYKYTYLLMLQKFGDSILAKVVVVSLLHGFHGFASHRMFFFFFFPALIRCIHSNLLEYKELFQLRICVLLVGVRLHI